MLMNRIRRVVPTFGLAGALLAMLLAGAAGAASPPVGDWRMNEGSGTVLVDSSAPRTTGRFSGTRRGSRASTARRSGSTGRAITRPSPTTPRSTSPVRSRWPRG